MSASISTPTTTATVTSTTPGTLYNQHAQELIEMQKKMERLQSLTEPRYLTLDASSNIPDEKKSTHVNICLYLKYEKQTAIFPNVLLPIDLFDLINDTKNTKAEKIEYIKSSKNVCDSILFAKQAPSLTDAEIDQIYNFILSSSNNRKYDMPKIIQYFKPLNAKGFEADKCTKIIYGKLEANHRTHQVGPNPSSSVKSWITQNISMIEEMSLFVQLG